ncbi:MAG: ArnT family glycosyltransferase [Longimicrobiaceae bacterium]
MTSVAEAPALRADEAPAPPSPAAAETGGLASRARDRVVLPIVWAASGALMLAYLRRGWVPHDEGTLAEGAERVLRGELPHRDFVEIYTGGLSYLNALSFRLFGASLLSPRIVLLLFALLWVPALYSLARRFLRPLPAGALALLGVAWSIPNYAAALPSWYNLMFATFGLAALLHGLSTGRRRWLAAAGACGGISILFKVPGIFFVAAGLLAIAYAEQCAAARTAAADDGEKRRAGPYSLFIVLCAVGLAAAVELLVGAGGGMALVQLALPVAPLAALLAWNERAAPPVPSGERFRALFGMALPFLAGVAVPLLLFAIPFAAGGALGALLNGVFVLPQKRTAFAAMTLPDSLPLVLSAALPALVLALPARVTGARVAVAAAAGALALALLAAGSMPVVYSHAVLAARGAGLVASFAGAVVLARSAASAERKTAVFAALAAAALCALVQFPFGAPIYFCYVAPLVAVAVAAVVSLRRGGPGRMAGLLLAFYLFFAVAWMNRVFIFSMGERFAPAPMTEALPIPRSGGIRVMPRQAAVYRQVVDVLHRHARGPYVYAGPDAPEFYFLAGYRNPTPHIFEFFDDPRGHDARLLQSLDRHGVEAIVLNRLPSFSPFPGAPMVAALQARYPHAVQVGQFVVAWREPGDARSPAPAPAR